MKNQANEERNFELDKKAENAQVGISNEDLQQVVGGASDGRVLDPDDVVFNYKQGDRVIADYKYGSDKKGTITQLQIQELTNQGRNDYTIFRPRYYVEFDAFYAINGWYAEDDLQKA